MTALHIGGTKLWVVLWQPSRPQLHIFQTADWRCGGGSAGVEARHVEVAAQQWNAKVSAGATVENEAQVWM